MAKNDNMHPKEKTKVKTKMISEFVYNSIDYWFFIPLLFVKQKGISFQGVLFCMFIIFFIGQGIKITIDNKSKTF